MALESSVSLLSQLAPGLCLLAAKPLVPLSPGCQASGAVRAHSQKQGVLLLSEPGGRKADIPPPTLAHPPARASLFCVWLRDRHMPATPQSFGLWYWGLQAYAILTGPYLTSQDVWQAR